MTGEPVRILVQNEDSAMAEETARFLRRHGYRTRTAHDTQTALSLISGWRPRLVVLDTTLEYADGMSRCREVMESAGARGIHVLLVTGALDGTVAQIQAIETGKIDNIVRPLSQDALLARIQATELSRRSDLELRRYQHIVATSRDGLALIDPQWNVLAANEVLGELFAAPPAYLVGHRLDPRIRDTALKERFLDALAVAAGGAPAAFEAELPCDDAPDRRFEVSLEPHLADGAVDAVTLVVRDVSETARAQRAMEESQHRLRRLAARQRQLREHDRATTAHNINEGLVQSLSALKLLLDGGLARDGDAGHEEAIAIVDELIARATERAAELRPSVLDDLGLPGALRWLGTRLGRHSALRCHVYGDWGDNVVNDDSAVAAYRVVEAVLNRIALVPEVRHVTLLIYARDDALEVCLSIPANAARNACAAPLDAELRHDLDEHTWAVGATLDWFPSTPTGCLIRFFHAAGDQPPA